MPIPFPPDGPQVQAALQKVPTSQLQNYAAGRPPQPTGQVTPGPMGAAAEALNARGAIGAANQRQQAMQNNPANSPTIFQQKDMELQQKAQQLAAMGQQIQQKEQQLGVLGALMAKKAQDMQARESMGVANLPVRPDMFTAMDGGIVFSGGGGVKGYNGLSSSAVKLGGKSWDELAEVTDEPASSLSELIAKPFSRGGKKIDPITGEPISLGEFLRRAEGTGVKSSGVDTRDDVTELPTRVESDRGKKDDKKPSGGKTPSTPALPGVASLGVRSSLESDMERLSPYLARSPEQSLYTRKYEESMKAIADLAKTGVISEQKAKELMDARKAEMAEQYGRYTKDRGTRQEEMISAMQGEEPTLQDRLGAGLKRLPVDLKGVRLGGLFGALGAGAAESDAEYKKRMREANVKRAEIRELNAKADLLEERGQMAEADKVRKEADVRAKDQATFGIRGEEAKAAGIASLLQQATEEQKGKTRAATDLLGEERRAQNQAELEGVRARNQFALKKYEIDALAAREAGKEDEFVRRARQIAEITGEDPKAVIQQLLSKGRSSVKTSDPAKALEAVRAIPFNDSMLISRAGLTADEMMKLGRSKTFEELPSVTQRKLNKAREAMYQQMTTGAADASLYE